jgi:hypothetical protein
VDTLYTTTEQYDIRYTHIVIDDADRTTRSRLRAIRARGATLHPLCAPAHSSDGVREMWIRALVRGEGAPRDTCDAVASRK